MRAGRTPDGAPDLDTPSDSADPADDTSKQRDRDRYPTAGGPTPGRLSAGGRQLDDGCGIA